MKKIKIAFLGFWESFDIYQNFITKALDLFCEWEIISEFERRDEVEYLFYTNFGYTYLYYHCIRIFFTGENCFPDFNFADYAIGFEHMEIQDRYFRYPLPFACYQNDVYQMMKKETLIKGNENIRKFCAMVVSNGRSANTKRDQIFEQLSEYRQVDSGGRYRNNIGKPEGVDNKIKFISQYKFSLACENASHPGYCTEKIVESFAAGTIPIYWGDSRVEEYFNPKAFINGNKFKNIQDLVNYVAEIDQDENKYMAMLKETPIINSEYFPQTIEESFRKWIKHIVMQDYEKAMRFDRSGWKLENEQRLLQLMMYEEEKIYREANMGKISRWIPNAIKTLR